MTILTIDFEASCLPRHGRSFPIEVGVAGGGLSRSWLIRPAACWAGWDWTQEAEALHGISRARIERDGLPAAQVLAELVATVAGRRVIADSPLDQYWLDRLAAAAIPSPRGDSTLRRTAPGSLRRDARVGSASPHHREVR